MRRSALLLHSALLAFTALGTLGLDTRSEGEIPETEQNVSAEIVDRSQTTTRGDRLSIEGVTYFSVLRGQTTIFVPFEKLRAIEVVGEPRDVDGIDRVEVAFTFQDGTTERGLLKARQTLFGSSSLGNFQLKLRDVRSIRFLGASPAAPASGQP